MNVIEVLTKSNENEERFVFLATIFSLYLTLPMCDKHFEQIVDTRVLQTKTKQSNFIKNIFF